MSVSKDPPTQTYLLQWVGERGWRWRGSELATREEGCSQWQLTEHRKDLLKALGLVPCDAIWEHCGPAWKAFSTVPWPKLPPLCTHCVSSRV
jgi:hypothetical protein